MDGQTSPERLFKFRLSSALVIRGIDGGVSSCHCRMKVRLHFIGRLQAERAGFQIMRKSPAEPLGIRPESIGRKVDRSEGVAEMCNGGFACGLSADAGVLARASSVSDCDNRPRVHSCSNRGDVEPIVTVCALVFVFLAASTSADEQRPVWHSRHHGIGIRVPIRDVGYFAEPPETAARVRSSRLNWGRSMSA
jgi:hypothetical protein